MSENKSHETPLEPELVQELIDSVRSRIAVFGQALQGVVPGTACACCGEKVDEDEVPLVYSVGNYGHDLPELLFMGYASDMRVVVHVLNKLGEIQRERRMAFEEGEFVDIGAQFKVKMGAVSDDARAKYTGFIQRYYETDEYVVLQALLCDTSGRYPGDPGATGIATGQPLLAPRVTLN
jgi:hypothetical protein